MEHATRRLPLIHPWIHHPCDRHRPQRALRHRRYRLRHDHRRHVGRMQANLLGKEEKRRAEISYGNFLIEAYS
jgi:hypothetical protein